MLDEKCSSLPFLLRLLLLSTRRHIYIYKKPTTSIRNKTERGREDAKRREKDISSFEYASGEL
jgi:hypothetical protein